ncbi:hypothetical protein GCM10027431_32680 [Lysobacter rhizosphaerae]
MQAITTAEEYVLFLQGETMALRAMANALIATHPDRATLAKAFETAQRAAVSDWSKVPPAELTRFRAEQVMDRFAQEIDDHGDAR